MTDLAHWTARPVPVAVSMEGRFVRLEPYERARHQDALWQAFGQTDTNALLTYFAAPDFANADDFGTWLEACQTKGGYFTEVFSDKATGQVIGMANYMRADPANGVVEVGAVAHSPLMQRSPASTEVHYLMARHVFDGLGYRRYEWKCHNGNEPSKRSAIRLGFSFEGVFRKHIISRGANRDTAWFAMVDDDWPMIRAAFEAWLAPDNFTADGRQKERLEAIRDRLQRTSS